MPAASRTRKPSGTTSWPMPSPSMTAILNVGIPPILFQHSRTFAIRSGGRVMHRSIGTLTAAAALVICVAGDAGAQAPANMPPYTPPKLANGQPDMSGIWQVLNTAAWDIQDHGAPLACPRAAASSTATRFRTSRGAGEEEARTRESRDGRSGVEMLPARRAAHHLHAVSVPDRAAARQGHRSSTSTSTRFARSTSNGNAASVKGTSTGGWATRAAAGKATRWSSTSSTSTIRPGSIARAISTATSCTSSSATRRSARSHPL